MLSDYPSNFVSPRSGFSSIARRIEKGRRSRTLRINRLTEHRKPDDNASHLKKRHHMKAIDLNRKSKRNKAKPLGLSFKSMVRKGGYRALQGDVGLAKSGRRFSDTTTELIEQHTKAR
jgi:hypothetical protein